MQYGSDISGKKCPGCPEPLTGELVYREGAYYHKKCWEKAEAESVRKAQAYVDEALQRHGFKPVGQSMWSAVYEGNLARLPSYPAAYLFR